MRLGAARLLERWPPTGGLGGLGSLSIRSLKGLPPTVRFAHMVLELKLDLSDSLAQEARSRGLLEPPAVERMLRAELKRKRVDQLFAAADRLAAQNLPPLTEAEVETEIQVARAQRRVADASRR